MTIAAPLNNLFDLAPDIGHAVEVAPGVLWMRLPLPMALDHVNIYALDDGDSWTIIDTGFHSRKGVTIWEALLSGPLQGKPVRRVVVTHHHPDHIGMAGWLMARGAELITTRTAWLYARMLTLDEQPRPSAQAMAFWRGAGMDPALLAKRAEDRPFNFCDVVAPLPVGFTRIVEGQVVQMGGRRWRVAMGDGHAPEHATFWSMDDALVIGGDQLLPGISANIGVYPTEPDANPLADWITSCTRFAGMARDDHQVLPGHKLPFSGLPLRLTQMVQNHEAALDRLRGLLALPQTAANCFPALFHRAIRADDYGLALVEAVAHLNYLLQRGEVRRFLRDDGVWLWEGSDGK